MNELELAATILSGLLSRENADIKHTMFYIHLALKYTRELQRELAVLPPGAYSNVPYDPVGVDLTGQTFT